MPKRCLRNRGIDFYQNRVRLLVRTVVVSSRFARKNSGGVKKFARKNSGGVKAGDAFKPDRVTTKSGKEMEEEVEERWRDGSASGNKLLVSTLMTAAILRFNTQTNMYIDLKDEYHLTGYVSHPTRADFDRFSALV